MKIDPRSKARLRALYPDIATRAIRVFNNFFIRHGRRLCISEGFRSFKRQQRLYDIGRFPPSGKTVTNAKPGQSLHQYGCALDVFFAGDDPYLEDDAECDFLWAEVGRFGKAAGFIWGGDFSYLIDRPHLQLTYGLTLPEVQKLYKGGGLSGVWATFDRIRGIEVASEWKYQYSRVKLLNPEGGENGKKDSND